MREGQLLLTYMEKMSDTVNSIDGIEEAFAPVAEAYQIAQLRGYFSVEPILAGGKDEDGEVVLFQSGDSVENGPVYNRRYPVKEKGEIVFSLCRKSKSPVFTGEEKIIPSVSEPASSGAAFLPDAGWAYGHLRGKPHSSNLRESS